MAFAQAPAVRWRAFFLFGDMPEEQRLRAAIPERGNDDEKK
jgi:hypothetical protein